MSDTLVSQGELWDIKDRELKWSQEEKVWLGNEGIYKKQANDSFPGEYISLAAYS